MPCPFTSCGMPTTAASATWAWSTSALSTSAIAAAASPAGDAAVLDGAVGLALTALDVLADPDLREAVRAEFEAAGGVLDVREVLE